MMASKVVQELAVKPSDMSDEEYNEYLRDVDATIKEVYHHNNYRCTNGRIYRSIEDGIQKSGFLLTIDINSIGQILVDNMIKIEMGMSDEDILKDDIVAGGDDVLQTFREGFDTAKYIEVAAKLGFKLSEFDVTDTLDGAEFFSNRYHKVNGVWTFKPERFTKHIMNLRTVKLEDLSGALVSHMTNHVWDNDKFNFLSDMYLHFHGIDKELFPLRLLHKQQTLQFKLLGCEVDC